MKLSRYLGVGIGGLCLSGLFGCSEQPGDRPAAVEMPRFQDAQLAAGRSVWLQTCRACHLLGVAGAPAITDFPQWESRLPKGREALYRSVLEGVKGEDGKFRMPPRGGNSSLSDQEVRLALNYKIAAIEALRRQEE